MTNWYDIDLKDVDTPALIIDKKKVAYNIRQAIIHVGSVNRLRPHVKTHKILEVARMQIAAGITKFKCATISEAEMLGMAGARDVLIAYQPQGPKINRVLALINAYPKTTYNVLADNIFSLREMNDHVLEQNQVANDSQKLSIYIDVNDGHNRTGIKPDNVEELVDACEPLEHIYITGLHCYDGHIRMPSLDQRVEEGTSAFKSVTQLKETLSDKFGRNLNIIAGGSPSFTVHARHHNVECSPGTFIFWDQRYESDYSELRFEKAAVVATRVISQIDEHTYCLDLGHKSLASEFPFPRVAFITDHDLSQIGHSEEHLVIKSAGPNVLKVGELLLGFPFHICPTVALYDSVYVAEDEAIIGTWRVIARDRKISI